MLFDNEDSSDKSDWLELQEQALEKAWDDEEDGIYDQIQIPKSTNCNPLT